MKKIIKSSQHSEPVDKERTSESLDIPEVRDIPGQEHIKPPRLKEFEDTTAASSDEEGSILWDKQFVADAGDNVSTIERNLLQQAAEQHAETENNELKNAIPDVTDADGDPLNENISYNDLSAKDLDIPDEYEDDPDEELGKDPGN